MVHAVGGWTRPAAKSVPRSRRSDSIHAVVCPVLRISIRKLILEIACCWGLRSWRVHNASVFLEIAGICAGGRKYSRKTSLSVGFTCATLTRGSNALALFGAGAFRRVLATLQKSEPASRVLCRLSVTTSVQALTRLYLHGATACLFSFVKIWLPLVIGVR